MVDITATESDLIESDETSQVSASDALTVTFANSGGTLEVNGTIAGGAAAGIGAKSTDGSAMTITINATGAVTSAAADAIVAAADAAAIFQLRRTARSSARSIASALLRTAAARSRSAAPARSPEIRLRHLCRAKCDCSRRHIDQWPGNVIGTGSSFDGIFAEILNAVNSSDVAISQAGNIGGGKHGIEALTDGTGNVSVSTGPGINIAGGTLYGIQAETLQTGNIIVTTATVIKSIQLAQESMRPTTMRRIRNLRRAL